MHTTFIRMKHIEKKLHFFQTLYIYHKDGKEEQFNKYQMSLSGNITVL
jgi:hypothetical protein